jgi:hypothetical protein
MAFIVVQHLDPTHESLLPEILAKKTTMAVSSATVPTQTDPSGCARSNTRAGLPSRSSLNVA